MDVTPNAENRPPEPPSSSVPASPAPSPEAPGAGAATRPAPPPAPRPQHLPSFRVLLHNDDDMDALYVVKTLLELTPLDPGAAKTVMWSAHTSGRATVLVTHQERAELYQEQLTSKGLTVSIEPEMA